ncbi:RNA polymerase sigma-70 factor (ECF subfamily) [Salirhabdus euzebyi]|uniref:RNA polymerase sigma-70 factor (ECF subfamily) n=1 Tax=Salirhabdus euzebyi TaxID=394506 RepID=A0A841Q496_9BACI|nr:sigma-70 family RNA polymerase sigma factor [Salirhabdus euzebyi]MBB6453183.1 RNA polymerase sigma-70 factor (ECF subfamily) [Salirhabdus euzebyi]
MDTIKLVKKAQRGHVDAFERLIISHKTTMYRIAKTILPSDNDCADAIQEAIVKAYEKIHTLREPQYFKTWLLRIVMNECNQIHRHRKNLISFEKWTEPAAEDHSFTQIEVNQMLATLPKDQGDILTLFHINDISISDLALMFEVPENTIKTRLRRAREKAKEIWELQEEEFTNGKMGKRTNK